MVSCYAQIINDYVLGYKIPELVKHEKIKARKLSYDSQVYLLMLGQFLHVFSLNELVDISKIYAKELSRIRGISPANLNTFSYANRTRNPSVMEKFFWMMYDHFKSQDETFIKAKHKGKLSRFKLRNIYAIDSTTIKLAYWCIKWAKHRQRKAAVKVHMVANVASRLPHFCVYGKANEHDSNISYPHLHSRAKRGRRATQKRDLFCLWLFGRGFLDAPHRTLDLANEEIQFKR